jgi:hypothetical protein
MQKDLKNAIFFFFIFIFDFFFFINQTNKEINAHMQLDSATDLGPKVYQCWWFDSKVHLYHS